MRASVWPSGYPVALVGVDTLEVLFSESALVRGKPTFSLRRRDLGVRNRVNASFLVVHPADAWLGAEFPNVPLGTLPPDDPYLVSERTGVDGLLASFP